MVATPKQTIALHHDDTEQVKFTDRDNHVFFMKMGKALEACRRSRELEIDLEHDEQELGEILADWIKANAGHFSDVAVVSSVKGIQLFFASKAEDFDVTLSEKLAELESQAISRLNTLRLTARQVSTAELHELRELEKLRRNADHSTAHQPVEA
jgi:hypothetical protein